MARKWEAPRILAVDALPKALGDCTGGSTDTLTTQGECGCHDGQNTVGSSTAYSASICNASVPTSYGHGCEAGGTPGTCFCGTAASLPE